MWARDPLATEFVLCAFEGLTPPSSIEVANVSTRSQRRTAASGTRAATPARPAQLPRVSLLARSTSEALPRHVVPALGDRIRRRRPRRRLDYANGLGGEHPTNAAVNFLHETSDLSPENQTLSHATR